MILRLRQPSDVLWLNASTAECLIPIPLRKVLPLSVITARSDSGAPLLPPEVAIWGSINHKTHRCKHVLPRKGAMGTKHD